VSLGFFFYILRLAHFQSSLYATANRANVEGDPKSITVTSSSFLSLSYLFVTWILLPDIFHSFVQESRVSQPIHFCSFLREVAVY